MLSSRAPIGKVAIVGSEMYCNQGFKNIKCGPDLNNVYLYVLLKNNTEYLNSLGRGATFKEISAKIVENIRIPVPPIELQNQFVEFFKQVDKSKFSWPQSFGSRAADYHAFLSTTILSFRPLASLWDSYGELRLLQGIPSILQVR